MTAMALPAGGPCAPWIAGEDVVGPCGDCRAFAELEPDLLALNAQVASEILYVKSGRQYPGLCATTLRPCCRESLRGRGYRWYPDRVDGVWHNLNAACGDPCVAWSCGTRVPVIDLGVDDAVAVTVTIDGAPFDASRYELRSARYLVRVDGDTWPRGQDLTKPADAAGTWSVTVEYGTAPPEMGRRAAIELACELTKHCQNERCQLPLRVTSVNRRGVTYNLADVMDLLDAGRTGLYFVDLFLATANPNRLPAEPTVLSPETRRTRSRFG